MGVDRVRSMYKLFELTPEGEVKTLFHGVNGSRSMQVGEMYHSERKEVSDGTNGTRYTSGFHCLPTFKDASSYRRRFTALHRTIAIFEVAAFNTRPKAHSRDPVFLADSVMILGEA